MKPRAVVSNLFSNCKETFEGTIIDTVGNQNHNLNLVFKLKLTGRLVYLQIDFLRGQLFIYIVKY